MYLALLAVPSRVWGRAPAPLDPAGGPGAAAPTAIAVGRGPAVVIPLLLLFPVAADAEDLVQEIVVHIIAKRGGSQQEGQNGRPQQHHVCCSKRGKTEYYFWVSDIGERNEKPVLPSIGTAHFVRNSFGRRKIQDIPCSEQTLNPISRTKSSQTSFTTN